MERFWEEFQTGEIHFRDKWQFELTSEFSPLPNCTSSDYVQEFYIFIPNALQINAETYNKQRFFHAQTNLIRFKTPEMSFQDLLSSHNTLSPLTKLRELLPSEGEKFNFSAAEWELKLYANIFQSTLAREVYELIQQLEKTASENEFQDCQHTINRLLDEVTSTMQSFSKIKKAYFSKPESQKIHYIFEYVSDTISFALNSSLTGLLKTTRTKNHNHFKQMDQRISEMLIHEKRNREKRLKEPVQLNKESIHNEAVLYQSGLLNKFVMDALQLQTRKQAVDEKFRAIIGGFAAGIAMLFFISLFILQGALFVLNSLPFVIFTVLIYVLKDRLKEELKNLSYKQMFRWFPDYTTDILTPSGNVVVGKMHESFTFINENDVPEDIRSIRNESFHIHLDKIKRPEQVIYYKKKISIYTTPETKASRLGALNVVFRYDVHEFMAKASNSTESFMILNEETMDLMTTYLPKVYHINIILKNSYLKPDLTPYMELKKFRLVTDKEGIKRIESVIGQNLEINGDL